MCGYLVSLERDLIDERKKSHIRRRLALRGPDDFSEYKARGMEIYHSRLAIQETVDQDRQPYLVDKRYLLVYNGEIYNFIELRNELRKKGVSFIADGDTEVLARGLALEGESFLGKLNGMYSFVFLDLETREALLCRDRLGIKPLYYTEKNGLVASTNAALLAALTGANFNEQVLSEVLNFRYEMNSDTSWENVFSLPPGTFANSRPGSSLNIQSYWVPPLQSINVDADTANEKFQQLLDDSLFLRTRSKRPITSLLSSGLDSSYLTLGAYELGKIEESYTLELEDNDVDVLGAKKIAAQAGFKARIVSTSGQRENFWPEVWDRALGHLDVPVVDTIIGPTQLLFENISKKYSVALSGEGADELLAGYVHFALVKKVQWLKEMGEIPSRLAAFFATSIWKILKQLTPYPGKFATRERLKLQSFLKETNPSRAYEILISMGVGKRFDLKDGPRDHQLRSAQLYDLTHWLPQYTLRRLDSLSASHGVEARVPYLDHRLVEHILSAPSSILDGRLGDKSPLRYAHQRRFKDYNIWKVPKTPFVLAPRDYFNVAVKDQVLKEILSAMNTSQAISDFSRANGLVELLKREQTISPLESKALFGAYLTARWMKIQSEQTRSVG